MPFYASILLMLGLVTAGAGYLQSGSSNERIALGSDKDEPRTQADASSIKKFKINYLVVYCLVVGADWVQGPHIYSLYHDEYGIDIHTIAWLFVIGFMSAGLTAPYVGLMADRYGRKAMCLLFTIAYGLACVTKMFPSIPILAAGRLLAGAATSILFSVFESWLVSSAKSRSFTDGELGELLGRAALCNGLVATASGVFSDAAVTLTGSYRTPFVASGILLIIGGALIRSNWSENYGGGDTAVRSERPPLTAAVAILLKSPPLLAIAGAMCAFESSMYFFVFSWVPELMDAASPGDAALPLGLIFSSFMVAMMIGSLSYNYLLSKRQLIQLALPDSPMSATTELDDLKKEATTSSQHIEQTEEQRYVNEPASVVDFHGKLCAGLLLVAAISLLGSTQFSGTKGKFCCFLIFEGVVGMYYPVLGSLRSPHCYEYP
ncbi:hypothetical protein RQP46_003255 [Phenoliferia psychrophenolica]